MNWYNVLKGETRKQLESNWTAQQERKGSGLGLQAQQEAVHRHIGQQDLIAEFTETESGGKNDRQQLQAAIRHAKLTGSTLANQLHPIALPYQIRERIHLVPDHAARMEQTRNMGQVRCCGLAVEAFHRGAVSTRWFCLQPE